MKTHIIVVHLMFSARVTRVKVRYGASVLSALSTLPLVFTVRLCALPVGMSLTLQREIASAISTSLHHLLSFGKPEMFLFNRSEYSGNYMYHLVQSSRTLPFCSRSVFISYLFHSHHQCFR